MELEGKVALVTGASGGLGSAICAELARAGCDVAVHYGTNAEAAREVADRVGALGRVAVTVGARLEDPSAVADMVESVLGEFGRLDILVNNAGVTTGDNDDPAEFDRLLAVNARAPWLVARACRPHLEAAEGVIINISSIAAWDVLGLYGVSKAAVNAITAWLARAWAPKVRVVGLAPGYIAAGMNQGIAADLHQRRLRRIPMGRPGDPEDVARAVAFLAGPGARFICGETVIVDGGAIART